MASKLDEILKVIGWTDGYHIPVLNEENEKLSKKIEGMLKEKAAYIIHSEDLTNRVKAIEKHIKDVHLHRQQIQALIYSSRKCTDSEDHMTKVAIRDEEKISQDIQKFSRQYVEYCQRNEAIECEIKQLRLNIEAMKRDAQFDQETLELWEEEILRKEKENQVIECYFHMDDMKVKEQNRQLESLQMEMIAKQQKMEKLDGDIQSQEITLENMRTLFRKMHANRQSLIEQWESCVSYMGKRDEEITVARHEINELQRANLQQREDLQEEERFLEGLQRNNRETEIKTQSFNREGAILMKRRDHAAHIVDELKTEISNTRRTLANVEKQFAGQRCAHKHLIKECQELEFRQEKMRNALLRLEEQLAHVQSHQMTSQERATQLEEILQAEELHMKDIDTELKYTQGNIFRNQGNLRELKEAETSLLVTIRGIEASLKILVAKRHAITAEHMQKSQMEYHLDFLIQKLDTRIARMTGREESNRQKELSRKIEAVERALVEKNAEKRFLTCQKTKLDDEERRLRISLESHRQELERIESSKAEEKVAVRLNTKWLEKHRSENQSLLVDENILRLKTSKAEGQLVREGERVFSLKKECLEMDTALKERRLEIGIEREVLEAKKRAISDEVSLLKQEVKHMQAKVGQLQKRYEIESVTFACEEEPGDEPMSLIRFNLKLAQEKHELQEEGDRLEQHIQQAEKEICALEATLRVVGGANDAYKRSLYAEDDTHGQATLEIQQPPSCPLRACKWLGVVGANGAVRSGGPVVSSIPAPEVVERKQLEAQLKEALELRRKKNLSLIEHQNEVAARASTLEELDGQIAEMSSAMREEAILASGLSTEIQEQCQKQARADLQAKRLQVDIRRAAGTSDPTFDEVTTSLTQPQPRPFLPFLPTFDMKVAKMNRQSIEVYIGNTMSYGMTRKKVITLKDGYANVRDERDYYLRQLHVTNKCALNLLVQLCGHDPEALTPQVEGLLEERALLKAFRDARSLQEGGSRKGLALHSSMTLISPKLLPPLNTPATSHGDRASLSSTKLTPTRAPPPSGGDRSPATSPALFTIDGSLFAQAQGRTSGTYKGAPTKSRPSKRETNK
ncbi:coiled-coil domain-containing protein 39-like [Hetaerina americana]|uniref:coiled-coil domain-containing protein 39-like n=1 Tax=Hetaerina americana TaxID=62018 RepID=UPI003A7F1178